MTRFSAKHPNQANAPKSDHRDLFHKNKTCIVTDLDGCLVNIWESLQIYLWDRYKVWVHAVANRQFDADKGIFHLMKDHFETTEDLGKALAEVMWHSGIWYQNARPHYTYWQALLDWQATATEPLRFLTARSECLRDSTMGWLHRWGFRTSAPFVILEGGTNNKLKHLTHWSESHEIVFIDDKIQTVIEVARANLPNVKCVLCAQPWNDSDSPDWETAKFHLEGRPAHDHPEFDLFLQHGFPLGGFRRLSEDLIAHAIRTGLE